MRKIFPCILMLCMFPACNKGEMIDVVELGAVEKEIFIPAGAGSGSIEVISNVPYRVEIVSGGDWLTLGGTGMFPSSRTDIPFRYISNQSFKRTAKVTLSAETRVDTVFFRQEGALADRVSLERKTFSVPAAGGTYTTPVECFRYPDGLLTETSSPSMVEVQYEDGILSMTVAPATARDPKEYTVTVYYLDGWGERASASATLYQEARKN